LTEETITHADALELIDAHLEERVYFGFLVSDKNDPRKLTPVEHVIASLKNPMDPRPPRLESEVGFYEIGGHTLSLAAMPGTVHRRDNGIDWRVADTVLIRIAWRGSTEVGNWRPSPEALAKFNAVGITLPEHEDRP
jgi:hypothetical protein